MPRSVDTASFLCGEGILPAFERASRSRLAFVLFVAKNSSRIVRKVTEKLTISAKFCKMPVSFCKMSESCVKMSLYFRTNGHVAVCFQ